MKPFRAIGPDDGDNLMIREVTGRPSWQELEFIEQNVRVPPGVKPEVIARLEPYGYLLLGCGRYFMLERIPKRQKHS